MAPVIIVYIQYFITHLFISVIFQIQNWYQYLLWVQPLKLQGEIMCPLILQSTQRFTVKTTLSFYVCLYFTYCEIVMLDWRKVFKGDSDLIASVVQITKMDHNKFSTLLGAHIGRGEIGRERERNSTVRTPNKVFFLSGLLRHLGLGQQLQ